MVKNVAAPKNTGGGGYVFENKVVATIFACMLARRPVLDIQMGVPVRVDFQTRPSGWFLDDALVTSKSTKSTHRFALSVKSNSQFTASAAPRDFVSTIWEQWCHIGSNVFNQSDDYLVLVTGPLSDAARQSVDGLSQKLITADPQTFPNLINTPNWASQNERGLFASLHFPSTLACSPTPSHQDTVKLLKQSRFISHDFDSPISRSLNHSLWLCQLCVRSGSDIDSMALWDRLCGIADTYRPGTGAVTREELVDQLRNAFELTDSPDYQADWLKLDGVSEQNTSSVVNKIAGTVELPRKDALESVEESLLSEGITAILGVSGSGKSVVARQVFEKRIGNVQQTLWIDARSLECNDLHSFETTLKLSYSLKELLSNALSAAPVLILDGLDRIYSDSTFRNVATLIQLSQQGNNSNRWRILIPCQSLEWMRISDRLAALVASLPMRTVTPKPVETIDLVTVVEAIPALESLFAQPRVASLLLNLKVLDLVSRKALAGAQVSDVQRVSEVSEVSVAGWFWDAEIIRGENRLARGKFARDLATRQADELITSVALDDFSASDLSAAESLQNDQICQTLANDRLAFSHDLYGDWVRLRLLRSRAEDLTNFLASRGDSPLWQRALRLFGLEVIEEPAGVEKWKTILAALSDSDHVAAKDAFLDGPLYSSSIQEHLESLLPLLQEDNGALLNRLLTRFLSFATGPGELAQKIQLASDIKDVKLSLFDRIPNHPVWPKVIKFLHKHRAIFLISQASKISELVKMWLETASEETEARKEAAELGIELGRYIMTQFETQNGSLSSEDRIRLYRCMLLGASEFPNEVGALALEAAGRVAQPLEDDQPETWYGGPFKEIDGLFRRAVLDNRDIHLLFLSRPALAREVILSTLVDYPTPSYGRTQVDNPILKRMNWLPTIFTHGPFLRCLCSNFNEGLELIIRLVALATDFSIVNKQSTDEIEGAKISEWKSITLVMGDGQKKFYGDGDSYLCSVGAGDLPRVVAIALMSLEQYFYMLIEAKQAVSEKLGVILARSSSIAILGVLADVGKRQPSLFAGVLRPLLSDASIFLWDIKKEIQGRSHLMIVSPLHRPPEPIMIMAREFNSLAHRKQDLRIFFSAMISAQPKAIDYLAQVKAQWIKVNDEDPMVAAIRAQLIGFLDSEWCTKGIEKATQDALGEGTFEKRQLTGYDDLMMRADYIKIAFGSRVAIDSHEILSADELVKWWDRCNALIKMGPPALSQEPHVIGDEWANAVTGCIALMLHHPGWCDEDASRRPWMLDVLRLLWAEPPERVIDVDDSIMKTSWECFMAESIAILWVLDIKHPVLREMAAQMVFTLSKCSMQQVLFTSVAPFRIDLEDDFYRLRRLSMDAAFIKIRCSLLERFPEDIGSQDEQTLLWAEIETWINDKGNAFINITSPSKLLNWDDYGRMDYFPAIEARRIEWGYPVLDLDLVRSSHTWLPLPDQAENEKERTSILQFWNDASKFIGRRAISRGENYLMEEDIWVLENLGTVLAQTFTDYDSNFLWMPILDLPSEWHAFPEVLMSKLHIVALASDVVPKNYVGIVQKICLRALKGTDEKQKWGAYESTWDTLLGLDSACQGAWQDKHEWVVKSLLETYRIWMSSVPLTAERVALFALWLGKPAANSLRLEALLWIDQLMRRDELTQIFNDSSVHNRVAALLNEAWNRQEKNIRAQKEIFVAFRRILNWLVGEQNPYALALSSRLGLA